MNGQYTAFGRWACTWQYYIVMSLMYRLFDARHFKSLRANIWLNRLATSKVEEDIAILRQKQWSRYAKTVSLRAKLEVSISCAESFTLFMPCWPVMSTHDKPVLPCLSPCQCEQDKTRLLYDKIMSYPSDPEMIRKLQTKAQNLMQGVNINIWNLLWRLCITESRACVRGAGFAEVKGRDVHAACKKARDMAGEDFIVMML